MALSPDWTARWVHNIVRVDRAVNVEIPIGEGSIQLRHERDDNNDIHTHVAILRKMGSPGSFDHGFYVPPSGEVIGPFFRD